ncbi:ATP-binding cassette domain-containing protein [Salidesulfovibrio onnuriiensis]|uniref:ATP-binding cassette domain-containing protein n=1 Tax=Salidesulfovibrio onnuriiensis TaxID=2583823 RepID=UPI00164FEEDF|nr:ATP-binding cassette domain-containing protein [Salidesulfovibrio onnuriiensis]
MSRRLAAELVVASFFVNLLSLAMPIFVIQILSRYIGYGFDGTLYTLTSGMCLALLLGYGFNAVRQKIAAAICRGPDAELHEKVQQILAQAHLQPLARYSHSELHELASGPNLIQAAFAPARVTALLDMPFFLLFFLAIYLISPILSLITLIAVGVSVLAGFLDKEANRENDMDMRDAATAYRGALAAAMSAKEAVRAFWGGEYLKGLWRRQQENIEQVRNRIFDRQGRAKGVLQTLASLLRVAVYAVGAKLVVEGDLTVGALIGVSILASKAFMITNGFVQAFLMLRKADETQERLGKFFSLPRESEEGTTLQNYLGGVQFKDVGFAYPTSSTPLFESLNLAVAPGTLVAVSGYNGSGKSTFIKMIVGLYSPRRGSILADGVDLRQLSAPWWRRRLAYLPQEPVFINGTFRDNITLLAPDANEETLEDAVTAASLRRYLDQSPTGLDTMISDSGASLPVGIRKRLGLARALVGQGQLVVFDEPTEGLDTEGCKAVYDIMSRFIQLGRTMFVVTQDPRILNAAQVIVDLSTKPVPTVRETPRSVPQQVAGGSHG